ncbi:hypothetical protein [Cupriavidus basilensis]|uniref:Uncharacterized protein n=1 Tax=Cupriavidus basilensis TaxID=68895 RepID=A0A643G1W1_9BURK|nr:hypothetical protein [Cupriavidus basilensis]QOT75477.1 hypothetical protein F7R26_014940 [Cupriavidus basilensis]
MKIAIAMAIAVLLPATVYAAGPANPADRYDYNMRSTNKDGYVPDPQRTTNKDGYVPDAERATNKDGYVPDTAKANDKFDPYTQGANQNTASALTDSKASAKKPAGKASSQKKSPTAGMDK